MGTKFSVSDVRTTLVSTGVGLGADYLEAWLNDKNSDIIANIKTNAPTNKKITAK